MIFCHRCDGSGFLNIKQVPDEVYQHSGSHDAILAWISSQEPGTHDVCICDCCGDGNGWYGVPGEHYGADDPPGMNGPYAYNGGLCECN